MKLEEYIMAKFCEFKFPLIEETENEVSQLKIKLIKIGRLYSGQTIYVIYKIKLKSIGKMVDKYLEIEINIRKENHVEFNNEVLIKIENNLINFIEHEFDNLIHKMREEANLIDFGMDDFENKFKPKIISSKDSSISDMKRALEMKKFELINNKSDFKIFEGDFDVAEICLTGHIINPNIKKNPNFRKPYCEECGAMTITECPKCNNSIPGRFIYKDCEDDSIWSSPPKFCKYCGSPYPWAEKLANEFLNNVGTKDYDAFLSHADKDKESIANELYERLTKDGFKIWYDKEIKADQSIPVEINKGIRYSKNGIAIFSNDYSCSPYCKEEFYAMKHISIKCDNFKLFTILHNFNLDIFEEEYPFFSHKNILFSKKGMETLLNEIEPQLEKKNISDKNEPKDYKKEEKYLKMSTNEIIDHPEFAPERNHSKNNHSKRIILENLKDIPITITKIVIKTNFPIIENNFNSHAKIMLGIIENVFNSIGEIEILLNQNPLILSPKDNIPLVLSLYTSSKIQYKEEYNFEYLIAINESSKKEQGKFEIKTIKIN